MIHYILARVFDGYYRLCSHRSHRLGLRCYRGFVYDAFCAHHLRTCPYTCEGE